MKKIFYLMSMLVLMASCSNEKKELYELATKEVRGNLKSPSSAVFEPFDERKVVISEKAAKDAPLLITALEGDFYAKANDEQRKKLEKEYYYDVATVIGNYEAKNSFGVMLKGGYSISFKRYEEAFYGDGERTWEIIDREIK